MCELFALSASEPVDIRLSFAELARHGGENGIHSDGWGVAFLDGKDARLIREPSAAAYSPWVRCLQDHAVRSDTVVAHIRRATQGAISLANTQPFARELSGRMHVFAHNGHIGEATLLDSSGQSMYRPIGETDSEAAFCILMQRFARSAAIDNADASGNIFSTFARFAKEMRDRGPANFVYASDGRMLVHADRRTQRPGVIEPPGLWILQRTCALESKRVSDESCVAVEGDALAVTLLASVPLTDEAWHPLEQGTILDLRKGQIVSRSIV